MEVSGPPCHMLLLVLWFLEAGQKLCKAVTLEDNSLDFSVARCAARYSVWTLRAIFVDYVLFPFSSLFLAILRRSGYQTGSQSND
jgi:hypothetical protein